jgi:glycerophosphoryl diester phosphodiesterase
MPVGTLVNALRATRSFSVRAAPALVAVACCSLHGASSADDRDRDHDRDFDTVQVGPRPYYLIGKMRPGALKRELEQCADGPFYKTNFSIGHRGGGTRQFPEHTRESYEAGSRMGAGIQECDVTFTSDRTLVCRHDQCDLHTTTNILTTPLAAKCTQPFRPAQFDATGELVTPASALCCTSDLTVDEFKSLEGKRDVSVPTATTPLQFQGGTPNWRNDLYSTGGTLLTHKESIELLRRLHSNYTPELKAGNPGAKLQVNQVYGSQAAYAQALIDDYKAAGISPKRVFAQSFDEDDILYWIAHEPAFGEQAVFLDDANVPADVPTAADLRGYAAEGIRIVGPPMWELLTVENGKLVPSQYAKDARAAGLSIITWTLESTDRIVEDVDVMVTLDVLARQVGIFGIFSDWSGTVSYYASCIGLK